MISLLRTFLKAQDHSKANKIGGWAGTAAAALMTGATLVVTTQEAQIQAFCADPEGYLYALVIWCFVGIGGASAAVSTATTHKIIKKIDYPKGPTE